MVVRIPMLNTVMDIGRDALFTGISVSIYLHIGSWP